jgi:glycosyltransferase involved in cell wall biosynthesis
MAADLFVAPSLEGDASLAVLEAMAAGLPVVATDIAAHRELIDDGRQGRLVRAHDAGAIAAGIEELLDQPAMASRLAEAARIRSSRDFTLKGTVAEHLALFDRVLSSARDRQRDPARGSPTGDS